MEDRIAAHQSIRDDLLGLLRSVEGIKARATEAGSYLFVTIPTLSITIEEFVKVLRLQANVTVTSGTEFGSHFIHSFRINFSQDHKAAVNAIHRTIEIVNRFRV